jgi:arginase
MTWARDLDVVVSLWQGADDPRVAAGPAVLAGLVTPAGVRRSIAGPPGAGAPRDRVRHLDVVAAVHDELRRCLRESGAERVLLLGSDCSLETVVVSYLVERHGAVALAWFDAHADLATPETSLSGAAHAMPLRLLLGAGHPDLLPPAGGRLDPSSVVLVGVRDLDPDEAAFLTAIPLARVPVSELEADPAAAARRLPSDLPVYVHLDLDVLDPSEFPAVGWATPGGPRLGTVARALEAVLDRCQVVGAGVTELMPAIAHDTAVLRRALAALGL